MPDTGSPWNLPFPSDTALVRDAPEQFEDLAVATAAALTTSANNLNASNLNSGTVSLDRLPHRMDSGVVTGNVPSKTVSATTVTFATGRFTVAPVAVAARQGSTTFNRNFLNQVGTSGTTTTSFTIHRANDEDSSRIITASWVAVQS
jgi:hypothetical protein